MSMEQVLIDSSATWLAKGTATRDLNEDYSRTVFTIDKLATGGGLNVDCLIMSALVSRKAFDWEAAERRADWEEMHGRFVEFGNVKDLLSDLHSS